MSNLKCFAAGNGEHIGESSRIQSMFLITKNSFI